MNQIMGLSLTDDDVSQNTTIILGTVQRLWFLQTVICVSISEAIPRWMQSVIEADVLWTSY